MWLDRSGKLGWGREALVYILPKGQPLQVARETWLLIDGETADCRDPRHVNDFLIKTYCEGGSEALGYLNGGVCAAVWEGDLQRLSLVTDFLGLRPLFYLHQPGRLAFASEIKALLTLGWIQPSINEEALAEWLAFEVLDGDRTLFKDIKRLPPGAILRYQDGRVRVYPYAHLGYCEGFSDWSETQWVGAFIETLRQSLQRRLADPQGYILPLSGGLDSRLLLALLSKDLKRILPLVTYGDRSSRDVDRARRMGKEVRYPHHILFLNREYPKEFAMACVERTEGFLNIIDSHGWVLNHLPRPYQVLVLGNGADLFLNTAEASYSPEIKALPDPLEAYLTYVNDLFKLSEWEHWFIPDFVSRFRDLPRQRIEEEVNQTPGATLSLKLDTHRLFFYEVDYVLHGLSVIRPRFEYTEPFLDRELVNLMLSLPPDLRAKRRLEKMALAHANPQLARIKGGPLYRPNFLE
ncbi:MAG: asparagine synthase-related protein, partial [Thermanaerothrix sp.]|nr:asparagine synthase-related protein [Thermanaerothrix sp.]